MICTSHEALVAVSRERVRRCLYRRFGLNQESSFDSSHDLRIKVERVLHHADEALSRNRSQHLQHISSLSNSLNERFLDTSFLISSLASFECDSLTQVPSPSNSTTSKMLRIHYCRKYSSRTQQTEYAKEVLNTLNSEIQTDPYTPEAVTIMEKKFKTELKMARSALTAKDFSIESQKSEISLLQQQISILENQLKDLSCQYSVGLDSVLHNYQEHVNLGTVITSVVKCLIDIVVEQSTTGKQDELSVVIDRHILEDSVSPQQVHTEDEEEDDELSDNEDKGSILSEELEENLSDLSINESELDCITDPSDFNDIPSSDLDLDVITDGEMDEIFNELVVEKNRILRS
ncbi:hypothetical protein RCL1_007098 [Eukaryota sp. TZLM3-RCL]